jgi:hypothetical protein
MSREPNWTEIRAQGYYEERCPTCGSSDPENRRVEILETRYQRIAGERCADPWHGPVPTRLHRLATPSEESPR